MSPVPAIRAAIDRFPIPERRACVRQRVTICGDLALNSDRESLRVAVLDISEKGALLQTCPPKMLSPHIEIRLLVAGLDDPIHATGVVIWSDNTSRAGIRFSNLQCGATKSLEEWLLHNFLAGLNRLPRESGRPAPAATQAFFSEPSSTTTPTLER